MNGRQKSSYFDSQELKYDSKVYTQLYSGKLEGKYKLNDNETKFNYVYSDVTKANTGHDWSERDIFTTKNNTWTF